MNLMPGVLEPRLVIQGDDGQPFLSGQFVIAAYQRGYRWGPGEVAQLLDDIRRNAVKDKREYLLQPIVVLPRPEEEDTWELIDGQQRLTTLYMIVKYIGTLLPFVKVGYRPFYETRASSLEYLDSLGTPAAEARRSENVDFHHMFKAYQTITAWFEGQGNPSKVASDFQSALAEFVKVIWYQAPDGTVAGELFARLNVARIPLTEAELVKALVLSGSADRRTGTSRQEQVAAQWDGFERDLRNQEFWTFLTGTAEDRPTRIDLLFETMTPDPPDRTSRPRYWTFTQVSEQIEKESAETFWRHVVERHGLLTGWFHESDLYHRVGYLTAVGDTLGSLLDVASGLNHSAFRELLVLRVRDRLKLTRDQVGTLRYGSDKDERKITQLLLLMNVETTRRQRGRFSFHEYASRSSGGTWSLEHIHAQNAQGLTTEAHWRVWLEHHLDEIQRTRWDSAGLETAREIEREIRSALARTSISRDDALATRVIRLFSASEDAGSDEELHGVENLALLRRDVNSELSDAVFSLKRRRVLEHDFRGAFIPPCTRNVFLKYYSDADGVTLHFWGPRDREAYINALFELLDSADAVHQSYLLPEAASA